MKLTHLGVSYYRSIGAEPVTIDLSKKITVLVGANNCGKSNVLRALERMCSKHENADFAEIDFHRRGRGVPPQFRLSAIPEAIPAEVSLTVLGSFTVGWDGADTSRNTKCTCDDLDRVEFREFNDIYDAFARYRFTRNVGRDRMREEHSAIASNLLPRISQHIPQCCVIPQFREIRKGDSYEIGGTGIVKLLASWHHPEIGHDAEDGSRDNQACHEREHGRYGSRAVRAAHRRDSASGGHDRSVAELGCRQLSRTPDV